MSIGDETRWLETVTWEEKAIELPVIGDKQIIQWRPIRWVYSLEDKEDDEQIDENAFKLFLIRDRLQRFQPWMVEWLENKGHEQDEKIADAIRYALTGKTER
jgi:hypothetical protein